MQLIAMLTMLIDHIGYIFFPQDMAWRTIGRIAFPIYCYGLVQGHLHTSSPSRYLKRLLLIAILAQLPYNLALDPRGLNVVFTLFVAALVLNVLDRYPNLWLRLVIIAAVSAAMDYFPMDYGAYGLLLVLIYRYNRYHWMVLCHLLLNTFYMFYNGWVIQMASILPTLIIAYGPDIWRELEKRRVPRQVWWSFYPGHLLILAILKLYYE